MKYRSPTILITPFIVLIFLSSSTAQDMRKDPQSGNLPENVKVHINKGKLSIRDIAYSPNGAHIAVASSIGILLYDTQTYDTPDLLKGHIGQIWSIAFSPDGKTLASGGQDHSIRLWNVNTGQQIRKITRRRVNGVAFSPDGKTLACGDMDRTIYLLDAQTGKHLQTLTGYTDRGSLWSGLAFSPNGNMLALCGSSGYRRSAIYLWDAKTGQQLRTIVDDANEPGHRAANVAFSPDSSTIASVGHSAIRLWDVNTGQQIRKITENGTNFWSVAFSPDGTTIIGSNSAGIALWYTNTGKRIRTIGRMGGHVGQYVAFSPDGKTIASGGHEAAYLWNVKTGQLIRTLINRF